MGNVSNIYRQAVARGDTRGINLTWTPPRQKQESGMERADGATVRFGREEEEQKAAEAPSKLGIRPPPPSSDSSQQLLACDLPLTRGPACQLACVF